LADGVSGVRTAEKVGMSPRHVHKWSLRFQQQSVEGLLDQLRPGRKPTFSPRDLSMCGQKWLAMLTPFFTDKERREQGCQHRLFFSQVEILTSFYVLSA